MRFRREMKKTIHFDLLIYLCVCFGCFACFSLFFFFIYIYFWQGLERSATEHRKTGNKRATTANQKKGRYL